MNDEQVPIENGFEELEQSDDHISAVMAILDGVVKPPVFIDDLPDAIVDGKCLIEVGSYVVIEKWLTIAQKTRWLGTSVYRAHAVDQNGNISLHDEELCQAAQANWKTGPKHGWRFKLVTPGFSLHGRDKADFVPKKPKVVGAAPEKKERKKRNSSPEAVAAKKSKEDAIQKRREERLARKAAKQAGKENTLAGWSDIINHGNKA